MKHSQMIRNAIKMSRNRNMNWKSEPPSRGKSVADELIWKKIRISQLKQHYPEANVDKLVEILNPRSPCMWLSRDGVDYRVNSHMHAALCYDGLRIPESELELAGWVKITDSGISHFVENDKFSDLSGLQYRFLRLNDYSLDLLNIIGLEQCLSIE